MISRRFSDTKLYAGTYNQKCQQTEYRGVPTTDIEVNKMY